MDGNKLIIILDISALFMLSTGITLIILAKKKLKRREMLRKIKARKNKENHINI